MKPNNKVCVTKSATIAVYTDVRGDIVQGFTGTIEANINFGRWNRKVSNKSSLRKLREMQLLLCSSGHPIDIISGWIVRHPKYVYVTR